MTGALLAGLLAGYGIAVPVGAVAVLVVGLTARTSLRVGAAAALGVATADGLYAAAAVAAGAALVGLVGAVAGRLRAAAALVLFALAVWTTAGALRTARRGSPAGRVTRRLATPWGAYLGLLGLTILNPVTIVYFSALVLGHEATGAAGGPLVAGGASACDPAAVGGAACAGDPAAAGDPVAGAGVPVAHRVAFVLAAFAASASWQLLLACGGSLLGRVLTGRRGRLVTALASSAVVAGLALATLLR